MSGSSSLTLVKDVQTLGTKQGTALSHGWESTSPAPGSPEVSTSLEVVPKAPLPVLGQGVQFCVSPYPTPLSSAPGRPYRARTQVRPTENMAHCFTMTPFPVLFTLRASCLLSLNLLAFALFSEELRPGVFRAMGRGDVGPSTSTCLKGTHPDPALWTLVKPRNHHHTSGSRWWCSTCGTWALRQDSCFSALSTKPHSDSLSQRQKPLQEGCLRCGGLFGVWEHALPNPSFSTPPLLSGPRFFLQFEEDDEEVVTSQGTGFGTGLDPSQAGWSTGSVGLSQT